MLINEHAVDAMQAYLRSKRYILPSGIARAALTAAAPFLTGVKVEARQALDRFAEAAKNWGWQEDQGYNEGVIEEAKSEFDASYAALENLLSAIEPAPSPRAQALEEAAKGIIRDTTPALLSLTESGIPTDIQGLLVYGNAHTVGPNALGKAIAAAIRGLSSQPVGGGWLPVTTGLNAIGYEIGGGYILKLSYDNLSQFEAAKEAIQSHLPASPEVSG